MNKPWFVFSSIAIALVLAAVAPCSNDETFRAGSANTYAHQSADQVTIGAKVFDTDELVAQAFGKKVDLLKYGIVPVLVVIENKRQTPLDLRDIEVSLVATDGRHASSVNPEDFASLGKHGKHPATMTPLPRIPLPKRGNPLNSPELVVRAFSAKMLPAGDSASGFFYFEAKPEPGDNLYVSGLRDARSRQEILYFEFQFDK
jgi:hypothetical protein